MTDHALVLFSGGQDSATCLAWALARYRHVETVGFAYGQRHAIELDCRETLRRGMADIADWSGRLGPDHMVDMTSAMAAVGQTALTSETEIAMTGEGLPNTFVPGRNLLFLTYAAAIAYRRGLRRIVAGLHFHRRPVDGGAVEPWWGAGLQPPQREAGALKGL